MTVTSRYLLMGFLLKNEFTVQVGLINVNKQKLKDHLV